MSGSHQMFAQSAPARTNFFSQETSLDVEDDAERVEYDISDEDNDNQTVENHLPGNRGTDPKGYSIRQSLLPIAVYTIIAMVYNTYYEVYSIFSATATPLPGLGFKPYLISMYFLPFDIVSRHRVHHKWASWVDCTAIRIPAN